MTISKERQQYLKDFEAKGNFEGFTTGESSSYVRTRPQYTRQDYERGRPAENIPLGLTQQELHEIMKLCVSVYDRIGVVKSFIDILSEFVAGGMNIVHPDPAVHKFYQAWWEKVNGPDRAERYASWLFKGGNVVVRRQFAKMKDSDVTNIRRSANVDNLLPDAGLKAATAGRVPIKYTFYNPATVDLVGDHFAVFANKKVYALRVPLTNFMSLTHPKNELEQKVYDSLPQDIKDGIEGNRIQGYFHIPLPEALVYVDHYKKDDTDMWAKPLTYSILDDIFYNDKLKLAKTTALDGMINCVRLWKLGDHTHQVLPSPGQSRKLATILSNATGGGATTVIWDSAIDYQEFYPPIDKLVNFEENIDAILLGLGVPKSLVGGMEEGGSKVNMMSFKSLLRKIEAGRRSLIKFFENEIDLIQEAMGFRKRPFIQFPQVDLYDDQVWYDLLVKLVDRNIISDERMLELIKDNPELEKMRVKLEEAQRNRDEKPPKASVLHNPLLDKQHAHELKQTKLQSQSRNMAAEKPTGNTSKGRPVGKRDAMPRSRTSKASYAALGEVIYTKVEEFVTAAMLHTWNCSDMRRLSASQKAELDEAISWLFIQVPPTSDPKDEDILRAYSTPIGPLSEYTNVYNNAMASLKPEEVTQAKKKLLRTIAYAEAWANHEDISQRD